MNIYVASSWRNEHQPKVVRFLRNLGQDAVGASGDDSIVVYDFRYPDDSNSGFHWSEIDPNWQRWNIHQYIKGLDHPLACDGFDRDFAAMQAADTCVLVLPCGRSAHLEAGWFVGQGKRLIVLVVGPVEPELMYKMATAVAGGSVLGMALIELRKVLRKVVSESSQKE